MHSMQLQCSAIMIGYSWHCFSFRLQTLQRGKRKDEDILKIGQKLFQTQWEGKESEYKGLIKQLEKKVSQGEGKHKTKEKLHVTNR